MVTATARFPLTESTERKVRGSLLGHAVQVAIIR